MNSAMLQTKQPKVRTTLNFKFAQVCILYQEHAVQSQTICQTLHLVTFLSCSHAA